ncbi:HNH endonuclease [Shewanella sp. NFH-SH190041]|nr:HNH endonuclease [Shewanella sp. NFH-SH190041]
MPPRTPKPCAYRGCKRVTTERYCDEHKSCGWEAHQQGKSASERGYGWSWQKLRMQVLKRDKFLCCECRRKGKAVPANDVDHIVAKAHGGSDSMDNLESLCRKCHRAKTALERAQ